MVEYVCLFACMFVYMQIRLDTLAMLVASCVWMYVRVYECISE